MLCKTIPLISQFPKTNKKFLPTNPTFFTNSVNFTINPNLFVNTQINVIVAFSWDVREVCSVISFSRWMIRKFSIGNRKSLTSQILPGKLDYVVKIITQNFPGFNLETFLMEQEITHRGFSTQNMWG